MSASAFGPIKRERKKPVKFDPLSYRVGPVTVAPYGDEDKVKAAKAHLKKVSDDAPFNATPSLTLNDSGVCLIDTAKMAPRSKQEVWNYAYLTNAYLKKKDKKIKSTQKAHREQQDFCGAVRKINEDLFGELNDGKDTYNKLFSVVAHVPDQAISGKDACTASCGQKGMYQVPGWLPMTRQANALVAQLAGKTGKFVNEIWVDGKVPDCLIEPNAYASPHTPTGAEGKKEEEAPKETSSSSESESN